MSIKARIKSKFASLAERFLLPRDQRASLRKLREEFLPGRDITGDEPFTVAVEGIVGMRFASLYHLLLLLLLRHKIGKPVKLIVFCCNKRNCHMVANRLYRGFFPVTYVPMKGFLNGNETQRVCDVTAEIMQTADTGAALFEVCYNGIHIGRDIYYDYLRRNLIGSVDKLSSQIEKNINQAITNLFSVDKAIRLYSPKLLFITDNCYASFSPLFHTFLLHRIPVAFTVPHEPGTGRVSGRLYTSLEESELPPRRYPFSFTDDTWQEIRRKYDPACDKIITEYLSNRFSGNETNYNGDYHKSTLKLAKDALSERLGVPSSCSKTVLLAAHLYWDDPGYKGLYRDYEVWLKETLRIIAENPSVFWVVKAHPSEVHMQTNRYSRDIIAEVFGGVLPPHICFLEGGTDINTYSLIDFCDAVLTVRGTIGFEAACKGKLVISAGFGPYTGLGIGKEFLSQEDYREYLLELHNVDTELAEEEVRNARMALFGYIMLKTPRSETLKKGDDLAAYATLKREGLFSDTTLNRFVDKILTSKGGDLL
jgi:Capsule polysaccharide biosynthesis protein